MHTLIGRLRNGDEQGSVILAVTLLLVLGIAVGGFVGSVHSGLNLTRNDQNRTNAFQHANAGIDRALWRIDSNSLPPVGSGGFTTPDGRYGFRETVAVGGSTYAVEATRDAVTRDRKWTIRSVGTDPSGRKRQAIASVEARSLFVNGFFTLTDFGVSGTQDNPIAYRSSVCLDPRGRSDAPCILPAPVPGTLGSNGTLFAGSLSPGRLATYESAWLGFRLYGRASLAAARPYCAPNAQGVGQCSDAKIIPETDPYPVEMPSRSAFVSPCPTGQTVIAPGNYLCPQGLTLGPGNVTVSGTGNVRIWVDGDFGVAPGTRVNEAQRPERMQIFQPAKANGTPYGGSICEQGSQVVQIWGLLYTPGLGINCEGENQPFIVGAVVAHLYAGGGNQFDFIWDVDSRDAVHNGKFVIKNWRECPATTTNC